MDQRSLLFKGLKAKQLETLRGSSSYRRVDPGEDIFLEGDVAVNLFIIISGAVQILKERKSGSESLATLGSGDVFGEMGLLGTKKTRTATARAMEPTVLFEIFSDPIELSEELGDPAATITLMRNLISLLYRRLGRKQARVAAPLAKRKNKTAEKIVDEIEAYLPKGFFRQFFTRGELAPGLNLCNEGDPSDSFYLIETGQLNVFTEVNEPEPRQIGEVHAPALVGAEGFVSGQPRGATLRAYTKVRYSVFSSSDFARLQKHDPRGALRLLYALARLSVELILEREVD